MPKRSHCLDDNEQRSLDREIDSRDSPEPDENEPDDTSLRESGSEWIFEGNLKASFDEDPSHEADSPEMLRLIFETWTDFYFPKCPARIDYLVMFNDTSGNRIKYFHETKEYVLEYNVRAYIQGQSATLAQLVNWIQQPVAWYKASGIALMDSYIQDMKNASDPSSPVRILLTSGKRTAFRLRSAAWSFAGSIQLSAISLQDETDLQDIVLDKFGKICTIPIPDIPASYCTVQCGIRNWASGESDPIIPIRGFISGARCELSTLNTWIPSFSFKPISGGLFGDPQFQAAVADAKNESSSWIEIFAKGELKRSNRARIAKKDESDEVHNYLDDSTQSDDPPLANDELFCCVCRLPLRAPRNVHHRNRVSQAPGQPSAGSRSQRCCSTQHV